MPRLVREFAMLFALGAAFCMAFLLHPDSNLREAHRECPGEAVQVFETMQACTVGQAPGCGCFRPLNPWASVYWYGVLSLTGIAAAFLVQLRLLPGMAAVAVSLQIARFCGLLIQSKREPFDGETWAAGVLWFGLSAIAVLVVFGIVRALIHWPRAAELRQSG